MAKKIKIPVQGGKPEEANLDGDVILISHERKPRINGGEITLTRKDNGAVLDNYIYSSENGISKTARLKKHKHDLMRWRE